MSAVDVSVALLGYEAVGSAVHRRLDEATDEIERVTARTTRKRYAEHRVLSLAVSPRGAPS